MEKLRNSGLLKIICYILIPILVAIFFLSMFHIAVLDEFSNEKETEYTQTENFANDYYSFFMNKIIQLPECKSSKNSGDYIELNDEKSNKYFYYKYEEVIDDIGLYIDYIIINRETKEIYTNIKSNNYEQEINNIKNKEIYWNFINGEIYTNLKHINKDNIKYNYNYNTIVYNSEQKEIKDYDIYSFYNEEKAERTSNFLLNKNIYNFMSKHTNLPIYTSIFSTIFLVIIACYLLWSIGYKENNNEISLNSIDKIPYEIISIISFTMLSMFLSILSELLNAKHYIVLIISTIVYFICYIICAILGVTTIKRIKAKEFWKSFLTYKIIKWITNKIKKYIDVVSTKTVGKRRVFWYYWGFVFISIILASTFSTGIGLLLLIAFWIWTYYKIRKYQNQEQEIKKALQDIYEGKTNIHIDEKELKGILKQMSIYVNDIAGGFSNAIEESLKSERLKTELITNVSHDIKTPLTSIINYVDLIKKEPIKDKKIKEYIDILDKKSQRLKKLTEDLLEASKVSSGNLKLNIEEINIKELFNQTIGEFKDKFEEKKLKLEIEIPKNDITIQADSRYMYRIVENLFSNITKYAVENSRVYIDIEENEKKIKISLKNISKEKLNISSDELMQRFVRGDKSRYTEGSGLGLSIAQSLTTLQKGKFEITIDGDLFKVEMIWNKK